MAGGELPADWHGRSHAAAIRAGEAAGGREHLVCSQLAQARQRAVCFGAGADPRYALFTGDAYGHDWPIVQLFAPARDPLLEHDLAGEEPEALAETRGLLDDFVAAQVGPHGDPWDELVG